MNKTLVIIPYDNEHYYQVINHIKENQNECFSNVYMAQITQQFMSRSFIDALMFITDNKKYGMTEKEYESNFYFVGLMGRATKFDKIICYRKDICEQQEQLFTEDDFFNKYYTSKDATVTVNTLEELLDELQRGTTVNN